jgi:hypothetical protein
MGILDDVVKNIKGQLETNVSSMLKGLGQQGALPPVQPSRFKTNTNFTSPQAYTSQTVNGSFCPECGTHIEAGGRFCPSCGTAVTNLSFPEVASSNPMPPQSPVPLNIALTEYQQTTIFDFKLTIKKDSRTAGKFVVEGLFLSRSGTDIFFVDPEDETSRIRFTLTQRPPKLDEGQKVTVYFHSDGTYLQYTIDELVFK